MSSRNLWPAGRALGWLGIVVSAAILELLYSHIRISLETATALTVVSTAICCIAMVLLWRGTAVPDTVKRSPASFLGISPSIERILLIVFCAMYVLVDCMMFSMIYLTQRIVEIMK